MTDKMNKIQIRAEVFSSINDIISNKKESSFRQVVEKLKTFDDEDFLAKLLLKEFINTNDSERETIISMLLLNCISGETLERNVWSNLSLKTISDEKKYHLVEILKSLGKFIDYDKYLEYFEEPQKVIDIDTKKLLSSAMLNPEAQIDFLDFMETLENSDKKLLLQSMIEDYSNDDLANIISPIILYEKNEEILELVINELINSKSAIAYYPLKRFCELSKNEKLVWIVQKGLKEFKLAGINEETAYDYYKLRFNNSILCGCNSSFPDGKGNQGLVLSRIRSDNSIQLFCVLINDIKGIVDCFGFNSISQMELALILKKFSGKTDSPVVTFETALAWLDEAEELSFSLNNTIPYEYICWKEILFDIIKSNWESDEIITKALEILPNKECNLEDIFETTYLDKMFLTKSDNKNFSEFLSEIDELISSTSNIDLNLIEKKIKENVKNIFDKDLKSTFVKRLQKTAFLLMSNPNHKMASQIYELSKNDELLDEFFVEVLKKSVFAFYEEEFQRAYDSKSDNIFIRNAQKETTKLVPQKIRELLETMLNEWGRDA